MRSFGLLTPGGVSGYDEEGVLLPEPEELLSVMPDAGLRRSVFTSILTGADVIDAVVTVQALVNADGVEQRFSMLNDDSPFIRFSGEEMGRRFFFALLTGDLVIARLRDSVSVRFSPEIHNNEITLYHAVYCI